MKLEKVLARNRYVKIKLKKINTNHFEIKAKLNGVKGRFILDTGASNTCVSIDLSEKFNLIQEDSETKAAGAGAVGMDTKISMDNLLEIKSWSLVNCNIVLFDLSHVNTALLAHDSKEIDGIIGADILEHGKAIIDYENRCVYLKKKLFKY